MSHPHTRKVDYHSLMKKVEHFVATIEQADDVSESLHTAAAAIVSQFRDELGIVGGRLYRREGNVYALVASFPEARPLEGIRVPRTYPPIEQLLEAGIIFMDSHDEGVDRDLENRLGVDQFAAIEVGEEDYILAFNISTGPQRDDILFSLSILRHALNQKIHRERMAGVFNEARLIQTSILPRRSPVYGPYDIAGRSRPMDEVGGDFFDFLPLTNKIMGVAIADVSGHGLPAALQVRDIYTGLRMGMARDFKIVRTVERLNRIIHEGTLTSRFVSMFYGELELNGLFIYVNAGHPPPFRVRRADGGVDFLRAGGAVLGPLKEATYERGFVTLQPGDVVVLYTDGMVETVGGASPVDNEEFGVERMIEVTRRHQDRPAAEIIDELFAAVNDFGRGQDAADDRTVVVVKYPAPATP